jgi:iron complex transport system substrate-binding protein
VNVNRCEQSSLIGMEQVSFEALLLEQPDAIFVQDPKFYKGVFTDPKWKLLKAVQNRQVFYIPKTPINWLDRPPSFMRLIGTQWVASKLYPELYDGDIVAQTRDYLKLFFGYEADEAVLEKIFKP